MLELANLMVSMQLSHVFVMVCASCLQGMRFGETTYHCIECGIQFCASCQSSHAMTPHARSIVRIINYSWPPQPDVANAVASCSQCSREIKCRVECSDCLQCICLACHEIPERRQPWYRHREQHERIKGFIWLSPPLKNVVPPENYECECLTVTGCISHCERCSKVNKVGETLYLCRTCQREYNSSMELCTGCYAVESQKHQGHEFGRLIVQRVTDMPDDLQVQVKNWWRCSFPGCRLVTGPSVEWLHIHAEARLCVGDAIIDQCRESAGQQCLKTFSYRSRFTDPANPTNMKCRVCLKAIGYDLWNQWCNTCDIMICDTCVNTGRGAHRHSTLWTRAVKKANNLATDFQSKRSCDRCSQLYYSWLFRGFECAGCRDYHCCIACVQKKVYPLHAFCSEKPATYDLLL